MPETFALPLTVRVNTPAEQSHVSQFLKLLRATSHGRVSAFISKGRVRNWSAESNTEIDYDSDGNVVAYR